MRGAFTHLIGIDESGRGPLAGPVFLAAVCVERGSMRRFRRIFRGIKDPKRMTSKQRGEWFVILKTAESDGVVYVAVSSSSHLIIDKRGIMGAIRSALQRAARKVVLRAKNDDARLFRVLLDGGLKAQRTFVDQETIIKGDTKEPLIMAAALAAKVTRDRTMLRFHAAYPAYDFAHHKGYGTRKHYTMLRRHGLCPIHRKSFCEKIHS